ncbi:hypothetical protein GKQ77_01485 [Streptomyces sp. BG9H]|uniref:Uncharacterized protein n=1 Tax=Streptomyces anatolicus TaxID=2675858 RepID=A0ABS6YFP5_9ACTN|nr:hypothetical protein [Streptomyces anatolicus]MBW5420242.1 hypothetical protein [Streptomyces anatolicus]
MKTETTFPRISEYGLISDNRVAVEAMLDHLPLPAPTVIPRAEAVFVTVADLDDLGEWLQQQGGTIHVSSAGDGLELWTLLTSTPARSDGSSVPVRVSVPVPMGEQVMGFIRAAVAA